MKMEKYEEAIGSFQKAIEIEPKDFFIWFSQGICFQKLMKFKDSLYSLDQAIATSPTSNPNISDI